MKKMSFLILCINCDPTFNKVKNKDFFLILQPCLNLYIKIYMTYPITWFDSGRATNVVCFGLE